MVCNILTYYRNLAFNPGVKLTANACIFPGRLLIRARSQTSKNYLPLCLLHLTPKPLACESFFLLHYQDGYADLISEVNKKRKIILFIFSLNVD